MDGSTLYRNMQGAFYMFKMEEGCFCIRSARHSCRRCRRTPEGITGQEKSPRKPGAEFFSFGNQDIVKAADILPHSTVVVRRLSLEHPTIYQHECEFCGKIFESRAAKQSYCSHDCYIKDRFWRKEDTAKIVKCLQERRKPEFLPKWVKYLLL